jgi:hypothetical protein
MIVRENKKKEFNLMKLIKFGKTRMDDFLYITSDDGDGIIPGGKIIIKKDSPLAKKDIILLKAIED